MTTNLNRLVIPSAPDVPGQPIDDKFARSEGAIVNAYFRNLDQRLISHIEAVQGRANASMREPERPVDVGRRRRRNVDGPG